MSKFPLIVAALIGLLLFFGSLQVNASIATCRSAYGSKKFAASPEANSPKDRFRISATKGKFRTQELQVATPTITFGIGAGEINQGIVVNFVIKGGSDWELTRWTQRLLDIKLNEFAIPNTHPVISHSGSTVLLRADAAEQITERMKEIGHYLTVRLKAPYDVMPKDFRNARGSQRIQFLKTMLVNYLAKRGPPGRAKFYSDHLGLIHQRFIQSLNQFELSLFHYSFFDDAITVESQIEIARRTDTLNQQQTALGLEQIDSSQVIEKIRRKFVDEAESFRLVQEVKDQELEQARRRLENRRDQQEEERVIALQHQIALETKLLAQIDQDLAWWIAGLEEFQKRPLSSGKGLSRIKRMTGNINRRRIKSAEKQRGINALTDELKSLEADQAARIELFNKKEADAYALLQSESAVLAGSNFNPYNLDIDYESLYMSPRIRQIFANSQSQNTDGYRALDGSVSNAISARVDGDRGILAQENYGGMADSTSPIKQTGMRPRMVELLASYGIKHIYEISKYSAKDYFDKFHISLQSFHELLDELNVLGIHLNFDPDWDRATYRIRATRKEYYTYKISPGTNVVHWTDPYRPDADDALDRN